MSDSQKDLVTLLNQLEREPKIHRLLYYKPYPKQLEFHHAKGKYGLPAQIKMAMMGNQVGKTYCGGAEMAYHLTGLYPSWWEGIAFRHPIRALCASVTNELTRDKAQASLLGDPGDEKQFGTGWLPIDLIDQKKCVRKPGVPNAYDSITVKHVTGRNSKLYFRCYEQGARKFMSVDYDCCWLDEEPPQEIWSQCNRSTLAKKNYLVYITATPEEGMTTVVTQFVNDIQPHQALITGGWDDAPHFTDEMKAQKIKEFPLHEREMRSQGIPLMGAGLVFPFSDEELCVEPFPVPRHWPQIVGIDFGWDHPFAAAKLAWDREDDVVYLTADYRSRKEIPAIHAITMRGWGDWIPVAWPHDGLNTEKGTGSQLYRKYREQGLNLWHEPCSNPPQPGQEEGKGGNSPEAALLEMYERMESGRWKVFTTCKSWLEEKRLFHRGGTPPKLIKLSDDVISASRHAHMMLRHARVQATRRLPQETRQGLRNW